MSSKKQWEQQHPKGKNGVPARLFADENPATTIKGTGFKDARIAHRTIRLTSQPGVRYKQYWTIKAMRERAVHHPHQTSGMRDAIAVFDKWLQGEEGKKLLSKEELNLQEEEWKHFQMLCQSAANAHSYGNDPTLSELKRARDDLKAGRACLLEGLKLSNRATSPSFSKSFSFPLVAFTALFGAPGLHGYGKHTIEGNQSLVEIDGKEGLQELISSKSTLSRYGSIARRMWISCNRTSGTAKMKLEHGMNREKLSSLWTRAFNKNDVSFVALCGDGKAEEDFRASKHDSKAPLLDPSVWSCSICTFQHVGKAKEIYLACEICGALRKTPKKQKKTTRLDESKSPGFSKGHSIDTHKAAWGTLRPPTSRDVQGPRKRQKGLDAPTALLDYIVVMDFEWTADNRSKMEPIAEIIQFPAVVMKLEDRKWGTGTNASAVAKSPVELPADLCTPCFLNRMVNADAYAISAFDSFVKPNFNPTLTKFSLELCGITQVNVDHAPPIGEVVNRFVGWLQSLGLVDRDRKRIGRWCFATWGDCDIAGTLREELEFKSLSLPPCFDRWINLKHDSVFQKHYGREPRGGLRNCVESVGAAWHGRAHNGLVDTFNTAKIVRHMVQTGFRFTRPTRGLDRNGVPFGQRREANGNER